MDLPPYARLLGLDTRRGADGALLFDMPFGKAVLGRPGFLHGGAIAGLLEIAAFGALREALAGEGRDALAKPVNVTVTYLRGGIEHVTTAAGRVTRLGARIANVEAIAWQQDRDRPIASAQMNFLLRTDEETRA